LALCQGWPLGHPQTGSQSGETFSVTTAGEDNGSVESLLYPGDVHSKLDFLLIAFVTENVSNL
jgi:hypothetical protein